MWSPSLLATMEAFARRGAQSQKLAKGCTKQWMAIRPPCAEMECGANRAILGQLNHFLWNLGWSAECLSMLEHRFPNF